MFCLRRLLLIILVVSLGPLCLLDFLCDWRLGMANGTMTSLFVDGQRWGKILYFHVK